MAKYLDPKADVTFKKVFGEHKNLVISLLNALLPLDEGKKVESIEYLPAELVPRTPIDKDTSVDVRCEETGGRKFIVEMQLNWRASFKQRVLFNASKAYVKQLPGGEEYKLLQPVYSLNLVNDTFEPEMEEYYHYYRMVHYMHSEKVLEGLHLVFVELPKFKARNIAEKKMQVLWLRFLTEIGEGTREAPRELIENPQTKQALGILEESAYNEAEMYAYDRFWDYASREATKESDWREMKTKMKEIRGELKTARGELKTTKGELKTTRGKLKAANAELDKANAKVDRVTAERDIANAERDAAKEKLRQTVRNLKALNLSAEQIAAATGLPAEEVEEL